MEQEYKKTYNFLNTYMKNKGRKVFNELTIKEYNTYAKQYGLLNTCSIAYISGLNWREFKNKMLRDNPVKIKRSKANEFRR